VILSLYEIFLVILIDWFNNSDGKLEGFSFEHIFSATAKQQQRSDPGCVHGRMRGRRAVDPREKVSIPVVNYRCQIWQFCVTRYERIPCRHQPKSQDRERGASAFPQRAYSPPSFHRYQIILLGDGVQETCPRFVHSRVANAKSDVSHHCATVPALWITSMNSDNDDIGVMRSLRENNPGNLFTVENERSLNSCPEALHAKRPYRRSVVGYWSSRADSWLIERSARRC